MLGPRMRRGTRRRAVVLWLALALATQSCGQAGAPSRAPGIAEVSDLAELAPRFAALPQQVAIGRAFVERAEGRSLPPALVEAYRSAVIDVYTPVRLETALRATLPANDAAPVTEPVRGALQRLHAAAAARSGHSATRTAPPPPAIAQLAPMLPDTRLRAEAGVAAYRAAYILNGFKRPVPPQVAAYTAAHLPETVAELVRVSRAGADSDETFPGVRQAREQALADNVAALEALPAADVAALGVYYSSAAGRAATDALVAAFARANDDAAAAAFAQFLKSAPASSPAPGQS